MLNRFDPPPLSLFDLTELRDNTRYFGWANVLRGGLYVPVAFKLWEMQSLFAFAVMVGLITFHLLCIVLEVYRNILSNRWLTELGAEYEPNLAEKRRFTEIPTRHWFFSKNLFESIDMYKLIGVERWRRIVVFYSNLTKYSPEERRAGKRIEYLKGGTLESVLKYEYDTRVGELMHLSAWSLNLPPVIAFLQSGRLGWAAYVGVIILLDSYLVMLQRYNRLRVHRMLEKMVAMKERRKGKVETA